MAEEKSYKPDWTPKNAGKEFAVNVVKGVQNDPTRSINNASNTKRKQPTVDDLVEGMIRMMDTGDDFIGPVNLGNPGEFSMIELANTILTLTGSKSKIVYESLPEDDPMRRKPDITLAKEKLNGWEPKVHLEEGLKNTIDYFDEILSDKK